MLIILTQWFLFPALIVAGSRLEATEGQNVTISFDIDEVERADQVRIAFKQDDKQNAVVVAQQPWTYDDKPPAEVSLQVEERRVSVIIQHVSISRNSGVYTARVFFGKKVSEVNAVLVINSEYVTIIYLFACNVPESGLRKQ